MTKLKQSIDRQEAEKFILTADDVARMLGVDRPAVYQLVRRYGLPARKLKRKLLFHKEEVERWLLSRPLVFER